MRKIVLYIAMSLDGFIAEQSGGVDWLKGDGSEPDSKGSYPAFYESIDTVILGYNTYHQVATELFPEKWIYSGKKSYVLTHKDLPDTEHIVFTKRNPGELLADLKGTEGGDIWICGGADIVNQLLELDLIDRYCISIIPMILGRGIPLFQNRSVQRALRLISTCSYDGIVDLVYEPR